MIQAANDAFLTEQRLCKSTQLTLAYHFSIFTLHLENKGIQLKIIIIFI